MLVSGQLPMHATLSGFLIFWFPWIAFDLAASALLCRGRATLWDGTYSVLLTLEIFVRAARVVISPTLSTFKVTPKDGIDDGGWHALRQLHVVVGIAVVLLSALVLRALTAFGVVALPRLGLAPFVIAMALGVWELALVIAALNKVSARRQLRHHYRTPIDMTAFVDDDLVRMVDLTPAGAGIPRSTGDRGRQSGPPRGRLAHGQRPPAGGPPPVDGGVLQPRRRVAAGVADWRSCGPRARPGP